MHSIASAGAPADRYNAALYSHPAMIAASEPHVSRSTLRVRGASRCLGVAALEIVGVRVKKPARRVTRFPTKLCDCAMSIFSLSRIFARRKALNGTWSR